MGIQIIDDRKMLSKHQIQKMKTMVTNYLEEKDGEIHNLDKFLMTTLLPRLTFKEDGKHYNRIYHNVDNTTGHIRIIMDKVDIDLLSKKLKEKLRERGQLRRNSDDGKSRLWKVCENLRRYAPKNVKIPNPTEVVEQRAIFGEMVEKMPNSDFKNYILDCLN